MAIGPPLPQRERRVDSMDLLTETEYLPDQTGAGTVLNFAFTGNIHCAFVYAAGNVGLRARVRVDGGNPTANMGLVVDTGIVSVVPFYVPSGTALKVFAPIGTVISVWGGRYGA